MLPRPHSAPKMNLRAHRSVSKLAGIAAVFLIASCGESTSPPTPTSVTPEPATIADGTAGTVLNPSPTFVVKDQNGNPLGGVSVTITVTAGGGVLSGAPTQTSAGPTSIGQWTLGTAAGVNSVTITVAGLAPVVITVNGRPGPPVSIVFISGLGSAAFAGSVVAPTPLAQVRDQFNNGVPGITVTFTVVEGDGMVGGPVTTNASGNAAAPQWRLGKSDTPQTLRATAGALTAAVPAFVNTDYSVDLRFFGPPMPAAAEAAFTAAAARIRGAVTGDLTDVSAGSGVDLTDCGVPGTSISGIIDDVVIYASVSSIDGPGRILASAGPCFIRNPGSQTIIGSMRFDADDIGTLVNQGRLFDVILHEMLHVVGIGTLWSRFGFLQGAGTPDSRFTGPQGTGACVAIGGAGVCVGGIPLETGGGSGTADSHWRESIFQTELMTGFVGGSNPLSVMSIQSLADVGYVTNQNSGDSYSIPGTLSSSLLQSVLGDGEGWELPQKPQFLMTQSGRVTRVERQ